MDMEKTYTKITKLQYQNKFLITAVEIDTDKRPHGEQGCGDFTGRGNRGMSICGFNLLLQNFCSYCPDFEPEIEQIHASTLDDPIKYINNIWCENRKK